FLPYLDDYIGYGRPLGNHRIRIQFDLGEPRQDRGGNYKRKVVRCTRRQGLEMGLLGKNAGDVVTLPPARRLYIVYRLRVDDFPVIGLEAEEKPDVVHRACAEVGDVTGDYQVGRHAA